jgi:hypothetical protein
LLVPTGNKQRELSANIIQANLSEIGVNAKNNIDYSLTFLFSIGKIEYLKNIDAITLINDNNED